MSNVSWFTHIYDSDELLSFCSWFLRPAPFLLPVFILSWRLVLLVLYLVLFTLGIIISAISDISALGLADNKTTSIFNQPYFFSPHSLTFSPWKFNSIIQYALHSPHTTSTPVQWGHTLAQMMSSQQYHVRIVVVACRECVFLLMADLFFLFSSWCFSPLPPKLWLSLPVACESHFPLSKITHFFSLTWIKKLILHLILFLYQHLFSCVNLGYWITHIIL